MLFGSFLQKEATGKVKAVYVGIWAIKGIDFVPKFWQTFAIDPDDLEATWNKLKTVMKPGKLALLTKETVALAVSIEQQLHY